MFTNNIKKKFINMPKQLTNFYQPIIKASFNSPCSLYQGGRPAVQMVFLVVRITLIDYNNFKSNKNHKNYSQLSTDKKQHVEEENYAKEGF